MHASLSELLVRSLADGIRAARRLSAVSGNQPS
eukprot:CAMPEP_0204148624 /NCGR_PEP_ID=MMETSP0361-20130328/23690_1 /ASSEMBLY_ACC=CAM_ASM_000343 /TAXON_ID=268821 /ORGANISM="Scrippsiella Hangoei, Strain SHTV-5" /LENGTH=32 /DNA_ID= /DNA_START= /DNA_END= /DNA_ORIENTATION=